MFTNSLFNIVSFTLKSLILLLCAILLIKVYFVIKSQHNTSNSVQIEIGPSVAETIEKKDYVEYKSFFDEMDKTINQVISQSTSSLNFSIALFSIALGIFTLPVGFLSFKVFKDSKSLLEKVEKAPEQIIKEYHKNQLPDSLNKLFDENQVIRSEAIRQISTNVAITNEHYSQLHAALEREYQYPKGMELFANISILVTVLKRINYDQTMDDLFKLFEKIDDTNIAIQFIGHIVSATKEEHIEKIKNYLCDDYGATIRQDSFLEIDISQNTPS